MTVKELIIRLLDFDPNYEVCSWNKDPATFGVLFPDGSVIYLKTLEGKPDLQEK